MRNRVGFTKPTAWILTLICSLVVALLAPGSSYAQGSASFSLQFSSLPSAQGWTYFQGGSIPETSVFSVTGTSLIQNTIGTGFAGGINPNYAMFNVVNGTQPFVLTIRARILAYEGTAPGGFDFAVRTGSPNQIYDIGFTPSRVADDSGNGVSIDTTLFHTYTLRATPGGPYTLDIDGQFAFSGSFTTNGGALNAVQFGDESSTGANARAEVTQLAFSQGPSADLSLTMASSAAPVPVGGHLVYTITTTNNGPGTATGVTVTDTLDPNLSLISAASTVGNCTNTTPVTCSIGSLSAAPPGNSATIVLVTTPANPGWGSIQNTASVVANESDPTPGDNTATESTCQFDPNDIHPQAGGVQRRTGKYTSETAIFQPHSTNGTLLLLHDAETACGFQDFDWQQEITNWPTPSTLKPLFLTSALQVLSPANLTADQTLTAPPSFLDPVPGGYQSQCKRHEVSCATGDQSYPFYWDPRVESGQSFSELSRHETPTTDPATLDFFDTPSEYCLDPKAPCGPVTGAPFMAFTTTLVGIDASGAYTPLAQWSWSSDNSGASGGISGGGKNTLPADPNSGSGGITTTSINGVPQTPPSVSCTASPTTLWPPNGKSVLVIVSGTIKPGTQAIPSDATTFAVTDEYGQIQPTGNITLGADGSYSFEVPLIAARDGNDQDGRTYSIAVTSSDQIGNVGLCTATVTVPHDQGQ